MYNDCVDLQGGLKAAITADAIQGLTLVLVCIFVIVQGTYETGSIEKVYTINRDDGEFELSRCQSRRSHISFSWKMMTTTTTQHDERMNEKKPKTKNKFRKRHQYENWK